VLVEDRRLTAVWREEKEEILDTGPLECAGEVLHRLLGEIRAKNRRERANRSVVLDEVILGERLEARRGREPLSEQQTRRDRELVLLCGCPFVDVLEQRRERVFLERLLEVLVPGSAHQMTVRARDTAHTPANQLVEHIDILLYVVDLGRLGSLEDGEGGGGAIGIEVESAGLEKTANEEDVKKCVGVLEKLEGRAGLDKLVRDGVKIALGDRVEVFVELIAEDRGFVLCLGFDGALACFDSNALERRLCRGLLNRHTTAAGGRGRAKKLQAPTAQPTIRGARKRGYRPFPILATSAISWKVTKGVKFQSGARWNSLVLAG